MQVFKNKWLLASPLIAMLVLFIFVLALYPSATMKPVLLPIAIVNLDEGAALPDGTAVNMGDQLVEQMKQASGKAAEGEASPVKWVQLESAEAAREGMDNREMGLFISFSILAFFLMISAILSWTGIRGIVLFVLLLFFGAPLLALPAEFMNGFYRDWIHSWLPMRFMVDGLRELFFFGNGFEWNEPTAALFWISAGSLIVLLLSVLKPQKVSSGAELAASASS